MEIHGNPTIFMDDMDATTSRDDNGHMMGYTRMNYKQYDMGLPEHEVFADRRHDEHPFEILG